jgi:hypothetical protein
MNLRAARVCSDCDEVFDPMHDECPACLGRHYWRLRDYVEPLFRLGGPHETVINKVQKEPQGISDSLTYHHNDAYIRSLDTSYGKHDAQEAHTVTVGRCGRDPAGVEPAPRTLDYTGRVLGQAISRLLQICRGLDASDAVRVDEVDKEAVARP